MLNFFPKHIADAKELGLSLAATLVLPLVVLALDYFIRSKIHGERTWSDLVQESGPDCCVLSMGATGAIFVDPHIRTIKGMQSPLFALFLVLFLITMRVACIKSPNAAGYTAEIASMNAVADSDVPRSLQFGLWSLTAIFCVVVYGYLVF